MRQASIVAALWLGSTLAGAAIGMGVLAIVSAYPEYVVHFALECVGQGVLWLAYTHVCSKPWHRGAIWFVGTLLTTILTVHLIG